MTRKVTISQATADKINALSPEQRNKVYEALKERIDTYEATNHLEPKEWEVEVAPE